MCDGIIIDTYCDDQTQADHKKMVLFILQICLKEFFRNFIFSPLYFVGMSAPARQYALMGRRGRDGAHQVGVGAQIRTSTRSTTGMYN